MSITIDDLTKNEVEGTGVFDELMRSVKAHLNEELAKGSITDVNYSSVYLGALESTMQQSVKFLLEKDRVAQENLLTQAKIANVEKEGRILDLKERQLDIEIYNAKYQECLLKNQIKKSEAENQRILQETANARTQSRLITKQISKTEEEVVLYRQKVDTEKAQIHDKLDGNMVAGTIGRQNEMYRNQSNGYLRLAEQQYARMMLDAYSILQSNGGIENFGSGNALTDWGVTPEAVSDAVSRLKEGVSKQDNEHTLKSAVGSNTDSTPLPSESTPDEPNIPSTCNVTVPPIVSA